MIRRIALRSLRHFRHRHHLLHYRLKEVETSPPQYVRTVFEITASRFPKHNLVRVVGFGVQRPVKGLTNLGNVRRRHQY
jgi:hypothetical protein